MKSIKFRTILIFPVVLFALFYVFGVILILSDDTSVAPLAQPVATQQRIAIFGASGTAGDGILKAALADTATEQIYVFTRRTTPRIDAGVASGKVQMTLHMDYLDYTAIHQHLADLDAVYWALGTSSLGVDEETYGMIHVDFPVQFLRAWLSVRGTSDASFHYISSSDISADSSAMWAREKVRAENSLFDTAADSNVRVIAYRPDYIGPTKEEANLGQDLLYGFFAPVGAAVKARQIGEAMLEVTARTTEFQNGSRLGTRTIKHYSDAYEHRQE